MQTIGGFKFTVKKILLLSVLVVYDAGRGDHIYDPEPDVTWNPPESEDKFQSDTDGANFTGLLYAGALEFNWIVDIRTATGDQDDWAIGNLVSYYHVLTTCKAVDVIQQRVGPDKYVMKKDEVETQWTIEELSKDFTSIRIYYCKHYLWETPDTKKLIVDGPSSGSRGVQRIIRHPRCHFDTLLSDAAIIVMTRGIPAVEPRVGYMPTGFDYVKGETKQNIKLDEHEKMDYTSPVCFVASFGRNYINHDEFYVLDFKIKIRVYITAWNECTKAWEYICRDNGQVCSNDNVKNYGGDTRYCLRPRARVGAVCDRDRGAPLVCNGVVIGMVIRGAIHKYCNNLYKTPFVVEPIDIYQPFFDRALSYNVKPVPTKFFTTTRKPHDDDDDTNAPVSIHGGASQQSIKGLLVAGLAILSRAI